jgi:GTP-binding protein
MARFIFEKSAERLSSFPRDAIPEIALVGRSNAGKSSFLNAFGNERIAKVSQVPGKTRLLNLFYNKKDNYRVVDMPGYGYAARSNDEVDSWKDMAEDFLTARTNLRGILLIMDIRREWTGDEDMLWDLADARSLHFGVILTKTDKLSRSEAVNRNNQLKQQLSLDTVLAVSNSKKTGFEEIEKLMWQWVQP